jgi:hypothetical protein
MKTTRRITSKPAHARAMFGMVASVMLGIVGLLLFTFAQVLPAVVTLIVAIVGALISAFSLWAVKHVRGREPVPGSPHPP